MVNLGLNFSSLVGIILAVAGAGLYFLRSWRPKLARDHDIFFAAIGLLCGGILLFQGWRLDPILAFGQFLLTGSAIFFAVESIRLRGIAVVQAKERAPIVDDERYVSNVYRVDAELDELEPTDEYMPMARQIRGSRDTRLSRADSYDDDAVRRRPSSRKNSSVDYPPVEDRPRKRRPRPESRPDTASDWGEPPREREERSARKRPNRPPASPSVEKEDWAVSETPRSRRRPSSSSSSSSEYRYSEDRNRNTNSTDYVEYRPVDYSDDEVDSPSNFEK
ncbi:Ycf66-like protein [Planktothrix tepida]|uniref:Ycf66-like protein n=2 Tax=Planktothrix TaxID=54304 RepID=A0A1J1LP18_9CYAN|nr:MULTISPECIES: Ycf66 family protein [Planktothrix]CAD5954911.1 Ycf66-like protein [Planktothrix pseudagardhii]CAD5955583.1 Ycf66-like protein [Planktothrix tepida]CUR34159.1 Ycf66-like protein [Planktothrix tepida PCC 9214]